MGNRWENAADWVSQIWRGVPVFLSCGDYGGRLSDLVTVTRVHASAPAV